MRKNYFMKAMLPVFMAVILVLGFVAIAFSSQVINKGDSVSADTLSGEDYDAITDWQIVTDGTQPTAPLGNMIMTAGEYVYAMSQGSGRYSLVCNIELQTNRFVKSNMNISLNGLNQRADVNAGQNFYIKYNNPSAVTMTQGEVQAGAIAGKLLGAIENVNFLIASSFQVNLNDSTGGTFLGVPSRNIGGLFGILTGTNASDTTGGRIVNSKVFITGALAVTDAGNYTGATEVAVRMGAIAGTLASGASNANTGSTARSQINRGTIVNRIDNCNIKSSGALTYVSNGTATGGTAYFVFAGLVGEMEHSRIVNSTISNTSMYSLNASRPSSGSTALYYGCIVSGGVVGKMSGAEMNGNSITVDLPGFSCQSSTGLFGGVVGSVRQDYITASISQATYSSTTETYNTFDKNRFIVGIRSQAVMSCTRPNSGGYGTPYAANIGGFTAIFGQGMTIRNSFIKINNFDFSIERHNGQGWRSIGLLFGRQLHGGTAAINDPSFRATVQNCALDIGDFTSFNTGSIAAGVDVNQGAMNNANTAHLNGIIIGAPFRVSSTENIGADSSSLNGLVSFTNLWVLREATSTGKWLGGNNKGSLEHDDIRSINYLQYNTSDGYLDAIGDDSGLTFTPTVNTSTGTYFYDAFRNDASNVSKTGFMSTQPSLAGGTTSDFVINNGVITKTLDTAIAGGGTPLPANHPNYYKQYTYSLKMESSVSGRTVYAMYAMDKLRSIQEINRFAISNNSGSNTSWMDVELVLPEGQSVIENNANGFINAIGTASNPFRGNFNGNNIPIKISGIAQAERAGLFGVTEGTVRNINMTVEGSTVYNNNYANFAAGYIAGENKGTITNVSVNVLSGGISYSNNATSEYETNALSIGGLVGISSGGTITNADITLDGSFTINTLKSAQSSSINVGGAIGLVNGTSNINNVGVTLKGTNGHRISVTDSNAKATISVGGFVGNGINTNYGKIFVASAADSKYRTSGGSTTNKGSVFGYLQSGVNLSNSWLVQLRDASIAKSGTQTVGGVNVLSLDTTNESYDVLIGRANATLNITVNGIGEGTGKEVMTGIYDGDNRLGTSHGVNNSVYTPTDGNNRSYSARFLGTRISTANALVNLATAVNNGISFAGMEFLLTANITITGSFTAIGRSTSTPFSGYFNGGGFTITFENATINGVDAAGLFGVVQAAPSVHTDIKGNSFSVPNAGIYNLKVSYNNTSITASSNSAAVGGIAGIVRGAEIGRYTTVSTNTNIVESVTTTYQSKVSVYFGVDVDFSGANSFTAYNVGGVVGQAQVQDSLVPYIGNAMVSTVGVAGRLALSGENSVGGFVGLANNAEMSNIHILADGLAFEGSAANKGGIVGYMTGESLSFKNALVDFVTDPVGLTSYTVGANNINRADAFSNIWAYLDNGVNLEEALVNKRNNYFNVLEFMLAMQDVSGQNYTVERGIISRNAEASSNIMFRVSGNGTAVFVGFISNRETGEVATTATEYVPNGARGITGAAIVAKTNIVDNAGLAEMKWYNTNVAIPVTFSLVNNITITESDVIDGDFSAIFDGNDRTITINSMAVNGSFALFKSIAENGTVRNLNFVVAGVISSDNKVDIATVAVTNAGNITNVSVDVPSTGGFKSNGLVGGIVVANTGRIERAKLSSRGGIQAANFGGIAAINNAAARVVGLITQSTVEIIDGSELIAVGNSDAYFGGIAGVNQAGIERAEVNFAGRLGAELTAGGLYFGGIAGDVSGNSAFVRDFMVRVTSITRAASATSGLTGFGGIAYKWMGGNSGVSLGAGTHGNNINIGAVSVSGNFGGIIAIKGGASNISNVNVFYQSGSDLTAKVIDAGSLGGAFQTLSGGSIENIRISTKNNFTLRANSGAVGGFAALINGACSVSNVDIVQEAALSAVGQSGDAAGFAARITAASASVSNTVIAILNTINSAAGRTALYSAANVDVVANNTVIAVRNNYAAEICYSTNGSVSNASGVNMISVIGSGAITTDIDDNNNITVTVRSNDINADRLYSDVNNRTLYSGPYANIGTGECVFGSMTDAKNYKLHLSLYDLDIDSADEFINFAEAARVAYFYGIQVNLNADIAVSGVRVGNDTPFNGIFNGGKHTITMSGNFGGTTSGLFGAIDAKGVVRDLIIKVESGTSIGGAAATSAGVLAGRVDGTIKNVAISVKNALVADQRLRLTVSTGSSYKGIVAGFASENAKFENVWAISLLNLYNVVGSGATSGANRIGVLGWEEIPVSFQTTSSGFIFEATNTNLVGWYSNYGSQTLVNKFSQDTGYGVKTESNAQLLYGNVNAVNLDYVVSYFNNIITTAEQFIALGEFVEMLPGTSHQITLGADIVLGENTDYLGYKPIGTETSPFNGTFNGNGHTITINESVLIASNYNGIFGVANATFSNLIIKNYSSFIGATSATANGILVGALRGGSLSNIVIVQNASYENANAAEVGGIVGRYGASSATSNVWLITNDYRLSPTQDSGNSSYFNVFYMLNDTCANGILSNGKLDVTNFADGRMTVESIGNDFYGFVIDGKLTTETSYNLSNLGAASGRAYYAIGFNTNISTEADLKNLSSRISDASRAAFNIAGATYKLTSNITVSGQFDPIGNSSAGSTGTNTAFNGVFDGCGYTITFDSTTIINSVNAAPFGYTSNTSVIKNLIIEQYASITGSATAGALVGNSYGTVQNVVVKYDAKKLTQNGTDTVRLFGGNGQTSKEVSNLWFVKENTASSYSLTPRSGSNHLLVVGQNINAIGISIVGGQIIFTGSDYWYSSLTSEGENVANQYSPDSNAKGAVQYASKYKLKIANANDFAAINNHLVDAKTNGYSLAGVTFFQTANIDVNTAHKAIGSETVTINGVASLADFYSIYNGNGYSINVNNDITAEAAASQSIVYAGVFGRVGASGRIQNLIANLNAKISATNANASGLAYAGFVAYNQGALNSIVVVVKEKAVIEASPNRNGQLPTEAAIAGFTNKSTMTNVWMIQTTHNIVAANVISDSGSNTMTMVGATDNVNVVIKGTAVEITITGSLYSDLNGGVAYTGTNYNENILTSTNATSLNLQAVDVKTDISSEANLQQLAYDVTAGYNMNSFTFNLAANIILTAEAFKASIGTYGSATAAFGGTLSGNSNYTITNESGIALFGNIASTATISDLNYTTAGNFVFVDYHLPLSLFANANAGTIQGGNFNIGGTISGARLMGLLFGDNTGNVSNINYEFSGVASGRDISAVAYKNQGTFSNITVLISGEIIATSLVQGQASASAFVHANDNNASITDSTITVSGKISATGVSTKQITGVTYNNAGFINRVSIKYTELAQIGNGTEIFHGIASNNQNSAQNRGVHNVVVYYERGLNLNVSTVNAVGGGNGVFNNTWVLTSEAFDNRNGQNEIIISGGADLIYSFNLNNQLEFSSIAPEAGYAISGLFDGNTDLLAGNTEYTFENISVQNSRYELIFIKNIIETEQELRDFASLVNNNIKIGVAIMLGRDIVINGDFTPIGNSSVTPFLSSFDGQDYTITINGNIVGNYAGLFGYVGTGANITNLNVTLSAGYTVGAANSIYAGVLAAYVEGATIKGTDSANKIDINVLGNVRANEAAGGAIGYALGSEVQYLNVNIGASGNTSAQISARTVGGVIGGTQVIDGGGSLKNAVATIYGAVSGTLTSGGVVGRSYITIDGIYSVNRGTIQGGDCGLIIGTNTGAVANVFSFDYVGSLAAMGKYGNISQDSISNVWAIVCGDIPRRTGDIINYLVLDKKVISTAQFDFAIHGTLTIPVDGVFTIWEQEGSGSMTIEGVTDNKIALPYGDNVKGRFITVRVSDTIESEYDFMYFSQFIATKTNAGDAFASLATNGIKLGADLKISNGYADFVIGVPFDGQGHTINIENASLFTSASNISDLIIVSNLTANIIATGNIQSINNVVVVVNADSANTETTLFAQSINNNEKLYVVSRGATYLNTVATESHRIIGAEGILNIALTLNGFNFVPSGDEEARVEYIETKSTNNVYDHYFIRELVESEADLKNIAQLNSADVSTENNYFEISTSIELSEQIAGLKGTFNGNGSSITYKQNNGYAAAFTDFEGSISNLALSGIDANNTTFKNVVLLSDIFSGSGNTSNGNVWIMTNQTSVSTPISGFNYLTDVDEHTGVDFTENFDLVFMHNGANNFDDSNVFAGFEKGATLFATYTTASTDKDLTVKKTSISKVISTIEEWNAMAKASTAGVYSGSEKFELGADIDITQAIPNGVYNIELNGKAHKLSIQGAARRLGAIKTGTWKNIAIVGDLSGTYADIDNDVAIINVWVVNNTRLIFKDINRVVSLVSGTEVKFEYVEVDDSMKISVENNASLMHMTLNNRVYNAEYSVFSTNKGSRAINNSLYFAELIGNLITNEVELELFAQGNSKLAANAVVNLGANVSTKLDSITNAVVFNGNGFSITSSTNGSLAFENNGTVRNLMLRATSINYFGVGAAENLLQVSNTEAKLVNNGTTSTINITDGLGASVEAVYSSGQFTIIGRDNSTKLFLGYSKSGAYVDVAAAAFDDAVDTLVFANSNIKTIDEYNALVAAINRTSSITINKQPMTINIGANLEGQLTELDVAATIEGNFFMVKHNTSANVFGADFNGGIVNNLIIYTISNVIDSATDAQFNNVWLMRAAAIDSTTIHSGLKALELNGYEASVTTIVTNENDQFKIEFAFSSGVNMAQWAFNPNNPNEFVVRKSAVLTRQMTRVTVTFVASTLIKLNNSDLQIITIDKVYDGTTDVKVRLDITNQNYSNYVLDSANLSLQSTKAEVGSYAASITNTDSVVYFAATDGGNSFNTVFYIDVAEFRGNAYTVNISPREVKLQFNSVISKEYNDKTAIGADTIVRSEVLDINEGDVKELLKNSMGEDNWYDALARGIKLIGADGKTYSANEKLPNQNYTLDVSSVQLSANLAKNFLLDTSALASNATVTAINFKVTGLVRIEQIADLLSITNGITEVNRYFSLVAADGSLIGNKAAIDALNQIVKYKTDALQQGLDGKYWLVTDSGNNTPTITLDDAGLDAIEGDKVINNDNYFVTVTDGTINISKDRYNVKSMINNSSIYLDTVLSPTVGNVESSIPSAQSSRFKVEVVRTSGASGRLTVGDYRLDVKIYDTVIVNADTSPRDVTSFFNISIDESCVYYKVTKRPITITLNSISVDYNRLIDNWNYTVSMQVNNQNAVLSDYGMSIVGNPSVDGADISGRVRLNVGTYWLTRGTLGLLQSAEASNYDLTVVTNRARLTVNRAAITVDIIGSEAIYGYASLPDYSNNYQYKDTYGNILDVDSNDIVLDFAKNGIVMKSSTGATLEGEAIAQLNAGNYVLSLVYDTENEIVRNYSITIKDSVFVVKPREVLVSIKTSEYTKEYNQDYEILGSDIEYSAVAGKEDTTGILDKDKDNDNYCFYDFYDNTVDSEGNRVYPFIKYTDEAIGVFTLYPIEFDDSNYVPYMELSDDRTEYLGGSTLGKIVVTKAKITVLVMRGSTKAKGEADPVFKYTISGDKLVRSEHITGALSRKEGEALGDYVITQGNLTFDDEFYDVTFQIEPTAVLTITRPVFKEATYMILAAVVGVLLGVSMIVAGSIIYVKKKNNGGKLPPKKKKVKKSKKGKKVEMKDDFQVEEGDEEVISPDAENDVAKETAEVETQEQESKADKKAKKKAKNDKKATAESAQPMEYSQRDKSNDLEGIAALEQMLMEEEMASAETPAVQEEPAIVEDASAEIKSDEVSGSGKARRKKVGDD